MKNCTSLGLALTLIASCLAPNAVAAEACDLPVEEGTVAETCQTAIAIEVATDLCGASPFTKGTIAETCQTAIEIANQAPAIASEVVNAAPALAIGLANDAQSAPQIVITTACSRLALYCAMAQADMHIEKVDGAPNMGFHLTAGAGSSQNEFGGSASIQTTLGSTTCSFGPYQGCGDEWTDMSNPGENDKCKFAQISATTTVTGAVVPDVPPPVPPGIIQLEDVTVTTTATDSICEGS